MWELSVRITRPHEHYKITGRTAANIKCSRTIARTNYLKILPELDLINLSKANKRGSD